MAGALDLPPVIGHRGAAALAPENTAAAVEAAAAAGARWVEFDVRITGDRRLAVVHDADLARTAGGAGRVCRMPLAAVQARDAGAWFAPRFAGQRVPGLEEMLDLCRGLGLGANVEIKTHPRHAAATAELVDCCLRRHRPAGGTVLVSSFSVPTLESLAGRGWPLGLLVGRPPPHWPALARRLGAATLHCDQAQLHLRRIPALLARGLPVLAYTVNDPARARALLDAGLAAVFTDDPGRILRALA